MDNRFDRRFAMNLKVNLGFADAEGFVRGTTKNISETGVQVFSDRAAPVGTRLLLGFPTFSGTAEVVWTDEPEGTGMARMGMKFVSLALSDREALIELLEQANVRHASASRIQGGPNEDRPHQSTRVLLLASNRTGSNPLL